jgi:Flp pilus assembly protein TadD
MAATHSPSIDATAALRPPPSLRPRLARCPLPGWVARLAIVAAIAAATALGNTQAATSEATPSDPEWLVLVRQELKAKQFDAALATLRKAGETGSAEWNNLMGYTLRSRTPPDLATAETHYRRALEIEPRHRSALEYYGELLLMKNDLPGAEAILERLSKACRFGCEELRDLRAAIARHKAARK